jgi:hypothetical protein
MPQNQITVIVPRGVSVVVVEEDGHPAAPSAAAPRPEDVERYWREFLSDSGKKIFATAALIERHSGPGFTLDQIAANRSIDYESAKAWHRNAGRTAKRWREETGTEEPIKLQDTGEYGWRPEYSGDRTTYRLPPGLGETIIDLYSAG